MERRKTLRFVLSVVSLAFIVAITARVALDAARPNAPIDQSAPKEAAASRQADIQQIPTKRAASPTEVPPFPTATPAPTPLVEQRRWAQFLGKGACVKIYYYPKLSRDVTRCVADGVIGRVIGPVEEDGRRWWRLLDGWVSEEFLRFHNGHLPWPDWPKLPDSEQISYVGTEGDLWLTKVDSPEKGLVHLKLGEKVQNFAWSPTGTMVAYTTSGRYSDLKVVDLDGRSIMDITQAHLGSWSPTGQLLAYYTTSPSPPKVYEGAIRIVELQGRLMVELPKAWALSWSPDGRRVSYLTHTGSGDLFSNSTASILDLESGIVSAFDPASSEWPSFWGPPLFSPDNRWVCFGPRLYFAGTLQEGRPLPGECLGWSLDGHLAVVQVTNWALYNVSIHQVVQTMDVVLAGRESTLWQRSREIQLKWVPNSNRLVYVYQGHFHQPPAPEGIRVVTVGGGVVTVPTLFTRGLDPSPSGQFLAFASGDGI